MQKDILKYIEDGISIDGNPKDGYTVFTLKTQHFNISSLDELKPEKFEKVIKQQKIRDKGTRQINALRQILWGR